MEEMKKTNDEKDKLRRLEKGKQAALALQQAGTSRRSLSQRGSLNSGRSSPEQNVPEEEEDEEEEVDDEEEEVDDEEDEECGYWESSEHPLPDDVFTYNLDDGIWSYYSYVKRVNGEYIVTLSEWLDECPDNIYNDDEWVGNMVGKLTDVVFPENRQSDYITGKFATEKGWRNVQLPMGVADDEE